MKSRIIQAFSATIVLIIMCFATNVFAVYKDYPNQSVYLSESSRWEESEKVVGVNKYFSAESYEDSNQTVLVQAWRSEGDGWIKDAKRLLSPGTQTESVATSVTSTDAFWVLRLENTNWLQPRTGGRAQGWIWYEMK